MTAHLLILLALAAAAPEQHPPLPPMLPRGSMNLPVTQISLEDYSGRWHEIARLPLYFQRKCVSEVSADYRLLDDGSIEVRNRCRNRSGGIDESVGSARTTERSGALEVRFAPRWLSWFPMVWADYWVIDLDPDYHWAVVGGPSREQLWILARTPRIEPELLDRLRHRAEARGYVLDALLISQPEP
jgi:apolipoprotein D and lipocalin family protein